MNDLELKQRLDRMIATVDSLIELTSSFSFSPKGENEECAADVTSQMDAAASRETLATDQNRDSQEIT
jgi:hypothetical protein